MMTRLEERMRKKCDQYWPTRGTETYGLMTVTITATQELATYSIRTFQLTRAGSNESREIKQVQYTSWPDHGVSVRKCFCQQQYINQFLIFIHRSPTIPLHFYNFFDAQSPSHPVRQDLLLYIVLQVCILNIYK
jgi:protein tyrosine phosphatase